MTFTKREERLNLDLNLCGKDKTSLRLVMNDTETTETYTLSLRGALPISKRQHNAASKDEAELNSSKLLC